MANLTKEQCPTDVEMPAPQPTGVTLSTTDVAIAQTAAIARSEIRSQTWDQDEIDADMARDLEEGEWTEDGPEPGEECGRWVNGRLSASCSLAGTEECDFECPYRGSLRF